MSMSLSRLRFLLLYALLAVILLAGALAVLVWGLNLRDEDRGVAPTGPFVAAPGQVERGAYLARAGNCMGCHSAPGGAMLAGGRRIDTPFGGVWAPNLTPDDATGLGRWSAADFWRALHNGRSRDGHLLAPAFPYPSYTLVTRDDADAIYAYLRSVPAVQQSSPRPGLRFPFGTQPALAVWRALYFKPGVFQPDPARDATWNRGAYLVRGLGHCEACHTQRDALGGFSSGSEFNGGLVPMTHWYAPALASPGADGAAVADTIALLKNGVSARGAVIGPMADVVDTSTRWLTDADVLSMASFLHTLPPPARDAAAAGAFEAAPPERMKAGAAVYKDACVRCHGEQGEGVPGAYPPLAGNRSVTLASPVNVVQAILGGGYPPSTTGNPRPYGMPPFVASLTEQQVADVATYVRQSFGNQAPQVTTLDLTKAH